MFIKYNCETLYYMAAYVILNLPYIICVRVIYIHKVCRKCKPDVNSVGLCDGHHIGFWFLADRTNGRAYVTCVRMSSVVVRRTQRYVLWLNSAI